MVRIGLYPHKCKECSKKFEARSEYAYKLHRFRSSDDYDWFCSYKCLRAFEAKHSKKKKPSEREQEILDLLKRGINPTEVGKKLGMSYQMVAYIRDKWRDKIA